MGRTGKASYGSVSCAEASNPERMYQFPEGELKKGGANMHFNADDSSVKLMMDLIRSANDFCIVFGTRDYLGKIRVSENVTQPRPRLYAVETVSSCAPKAEETS